MTSDLERSMRLMASMATPMCIRVAATLRIAECLSDDGATIEDLAVETGAAPLALLRVMDHLSAIGVFRRVGDRYFVTKLGELLRDDSGSDLRDEFDINSALGRAELAFVELLQSVQSGSSAYSFRYGRDFWDDVKHDPELQRSFDAKMVRRFREQAPQIAERFDWSKYPRIVDVGGGEGTVLKAILGRHPVVRGAVVELPRTAARASAGFAAAGISDRAEAITGSFFEALPAGADAYILSDILHNCNDEQAARVLTRCAEAAGETGAIMVIEPLRGRGSDTAIDLAMFAYFGGCERTSDEIAELAAAVDLRLRDVVAVADGRTLLEFAAESSH